MAAVCGEWPRLSSIHGSTNWNCPCTAAPSAFAPIRAAVRRGTPRILIERAAEPSGRARRAAGRAPRPRLRTAAWRSPGLRTRHRRPRGARRPRAAPRARRSGRADEEERGRERRRGGEPGRRGDGGDRHGTVGLGRGMDPLEPAARAFERGPRRLLDAARSAAVAAWICSSQPRGPSSAARAAS